MLYIIPECFFSTQSAYRTKYSECIHSPYPKNPFLKKTAAIKARKWEKACFSPVGPHLLHQMSTTTTMAIHRRFTFCHARMCASVMVQIQITILTPQAMNTHCHSTTPLVSPHWPPKAIACWPLLYQLLTSICLYYDINLYLF